MFNVFKTDSFIGLDNDYEKSSVAMLGVPYDGTVSFRPGARFAPMAIRVDSYGLETYSPYLNLDLEDYSLSDIGDIEFPFGNRQKALENIESVICQIIKDGKKPLMVGGEHLITYPALKAVKGIYDDVHIIHFDAHTDLRDEYMGEELSHATVIKRVWDLTGDNKIFQFGIRSGTKEEFEWAEKHLYMEKFTVNTVSEVVNILKNKPVYITIDLDVLDPAFFPGTGTPEPGGISSSDLFKAIVKMKGLNIVGADIVELSPHYDSSGISTAVAAKVIREIALIMSV